MKKRNGTWQNLRTLWGVSLVLFFCISFFAGQHAWFQWLGGQFFKAASFLVSPPETKNDVVIVHIPELSTGENTFPPLSELQRTQKLATFIKKAAAANPAAIVLLSNHTPPQASLVDGKQGLSNELRAIPKRLKGKKNKKLRKDIQTISKKLRQLISKEGNLASVLGKYDVLVAIPVKQSSKLYFDLESSISVDWLDGVKPVSAYLADLPRLTVPTIKEIVFDKNVGKRSFSVVPVYDRDLDMVSWPMLWKYGKDFYPDLVTVLFARLEASSSITWIEGIAIEYSSQSVNTDIAAQIVPLYSAVSNKLHDTPIYKLGNIPNKNISEFNKKIVLISEESSRVANDVAGVVSSLSERVAYHTPVWALILSKMILVVIFFYLLIIVTRLRHSAEIILGILILFILITLQFGVLVIKGDWVPISACVSLLVIGHIMTFFRKQSTLKIEELKKNAHRVNWMLGKNQFEQDDFDRAFESLQNCFPTNEVIDKLYKVGLEFERQREYEKALDTFYYIGEHKRRYKDLEKRIQTLLDVNGDQASVVSPFNGEKTLVMSDHDIEKPVIGRYALERELGRGEMGIVYLGKDPKINRQVAIKTLNFSQFDKRELNIIKERFFREAETAGRLNHPNIVTIYDVGDERDLAFIAMDYIPGCDMSAFVKEEDLLPAKTAINCIIKVAIALDYAHKQGVVHRDIKPGNIIYNQENDLIKVTDFGIARIMDTANTRTGTILGSPAYMSPEQLSGSKVNGAADLFSLGVTLFQFLTGEFPFKGDNIASLAYRIANEKHAAIRELRPDLPKGITRLINKVLQKDPQKRYATGAEMKDALEKILEGL